MSKKLFIQEPVICRKNYDKQQHFIVQSDGILATTESGKFGPEENLIYISAYKKALDTVFIRP